MARRLFASPYVKNIRRGIRGESGQARGVAPVGFLEDLALHESSKIC
jgi:hypothetical protein